MEKTGRGEETTEPAERKAAILAFKQREGGGGGAAAMLRSRQAAARHGQDLNGAWKSTHPKSLNETLAEAVLERCH